MSVSVRGISSGIDINGIIDELMQLERQPIRRKEAMIERTEQISELWREVNSRIDTMKRTLSPLQNRLTYTAPVPRSSNEEVLKAKISGTPVKGSYRFNVSQVANFHSVASNPPGPGSVIMNPNEARGLKGSFYLGTGRPPQGLSELTFDSDTGEWLRGSVSNGFQAVVSGLESDDYAFNPDAVGFISGVDELGDPVMADVEEIAVYLDSFVDGGGDDILESLQVYFTEKGWPEIDLDKPLFTIEKDIHDDWQSYNQHDGTPFAFLGDHPLGTFNLRGEVIGADEEVLEVNNFSFEIRDSVDESNLIKISKSDSLTTIVDKINARSAQTGVKASIVMPNEDDYRIVLESLVEGTSGFIQAYDYTPLAGDEETYGEDSVLQALNILTGVPNGVLPSYALETEAAQDAVFTLNGMEMTRSSNTFTNVIAGLEINLTGTGLSTLEVAPDIDSAMEDLSLFVEAVNELNSYLRILQKNEEGPLQGSSDLMRIERQLRTLLGGPVSNVPGSSHLTQPLTFIGTGSASATATGVYGLGSPHSSEPLVFSGSGSASATATGTYNGTASQVVLTYNETIGSWRYDGQNFKSGDTINGVRITIDAGSSPAHNDSLTLNVTPPPAQVPRATEIELTYNAANAEWRYNGNRFESGDVANGIRITIPPGAPANTDRLVLRVSPPSEPLVYDSLAAVGILTGDEEGFLQVDDAKLREALTADPEGIYLLFAREAPLDAAGRSRGPDGIAKKMETLVNNLVGANGVVQNRQSYLQRQISQYQDRIEMLERRMEVREQRLVRQFTFMEQYIARIQEQTGLVASFEMMMQGQRDQ